VGFCARCGSDLDGHASCDREDRPGRALDPPRYCGDCGARLTVQVVPSGYHAQCLRCERRARFAAARA
jgi:hypothetical protein